MYLVFGLTFFALIKGIYFISVYDFGMPMQKTASPETTTPTTTFHTTQFRFHFEEPIEPFLNSLNELAIIEFKADQKIPIVLLGESPISTAELARKYAKHFLSETNGPVLWINSSTSSSMVKAFKELSKSVKIGVLGLESTDIIRNVFKYFKNRNCLFVFDDAKSDNVVLKYLSYYSGKKTGNFTFLITSIDPSWDEKQFYMLKVPQNEAIELMKVFRKRINESSIEKKQMEISKLFLHN